MKKFIHVYVLLSFLVFVTVSSMNPAVADSPHGTSPINCGKLIASYLKWINASHSSSSDPYLVSTVYVNYYAPYRGA